MSKELEYGVLLDFYSFNLTKKQVSVLDLYYNQDYSLSEIANEFDITRQAALDMIKRGSSKLQKLETELGLYKKFDLITDTLQDCKKYILNSQPKNLKIIQKIDRALMIWEDKDGV